MKLKEGEVICDECMGSGNQAKWDRIPDYRCYLPCEKCNSTGKLDWIENITGKKKQDRIKFRVLQGFNYINKNDISLISSCIS